jgi:hypothetical protein
MKNIIRTYEELITYPTFEERYNYLKLCGIPAEETFGPDRYLNQMFYRSKEWKRIRDIVILRDNGCDLGVEGYDIFEHAIIHHMNPLSVEDIQHSTENLMNPRYLITVSFNTHQAIHYGTKQDPLLLPKERRPNDMCPWKMV